MQCIPALHVRDFSKCFHLLGLLSGASSGPGHCCDMVLLSLAGGENSCAYQSGNHVPGWLGHVTMAGIQLCAQSLGCTEKASLAGASPAVCLGDTCSRRDNLGTPRNSSDSCLSRLYPGDEAENTKVRARGLSRVLEAP